MNTEVQQKKCFTSDSHKDSVEEFTDRVIRFWRKFQKKLLTWAVTARITFAMSPNSAACERVFSLLMLFSGQQQDSSLSYQIQTSLVLAYNKGALG